MRSLRLLSNRARGRLVFCFCSFVSSSLFFYAGTKNVSFVLLQKKNKTKMAETAPGWPPPPPKKKKRELGVKKRARENTYYDTGGHFLFSDVLEAKQLCLRKKKKDDETSFVNHKRPPPSKKRERKRENLSREEG